MTAPTANILAAGTDLLAPLAAQANDLADKATAQQNSGAQVFELRDDPDTTDETVKSFQDVREKILAKLNDMETEVESYIRTNLLPESNGEAFDVEAGQTQYKEIVSQFKTLSSVLTTLNGGNAPTDLPEIKSYPGVRKSSATGAPGVKRPRVESVSFRVAGQGDYKLAQMKKPNSDEMASNFSALAFELNKVDGVKTNAGEIGQAAFAELKAKHNTDDFKSVAGKAIEFTMTFGDKHFEIRVVA